MAVRQLSGKKPQNMRYTLYTLLSYMGRHKFLLLVVAVLVTISALANLLGTYMIRPVVNSLAAGNLQDLIAGVAVTAAIYGLGALSALGYTQTMVKAAQKVLYDIRRDLFAHLQTLPLEFFDTHRHGDVMSYFTNDVDTISDAMNNSFAMVIQSFIQMAGTLTILFVLNWRLSFVVVVCYVVMFLYIRFSGKHSKAYYTKQQASLGDLDGYIEEITAGQKVVKVFNHEEESLRRFRGPAQGWHRRPELRRHHGARSGHHLLPQLRHRGGTGGHHGHQRPDRCGQLSQLPGFCPPGGHAHQPVHPAEQLPAGRPGRGGAGLPGDGPALRGGRGENRPGPCAAGGWAAGSLRREDGPLGVEATGRRPGATAGGCALPARHLRL